MLKVAEVHVVRHKVLVEGHSQREVARELGISRNTVARYLNDDVKAGSRAGPEARPSPVRTAIEPMVTALLAGARQTLKQRLTTPRLVELLAEKGVAAAPRTVHRIVTEWRRQRAEVFIPLEYPPGDLAEVDFFELQVVIEDQEQKAWMFVMRLMHSGRDFAWLYRWQDLACFLDGHVRAFAHFGAVPRRILYDNLKAAVRRVMVGSERLLNERFAAMVAHYGYAPRFARPAKGSDKGGVESRGKLIRWQHLSPVPAANSVEEIGQTLVARLDASMERPRRRGEPSIADNWEVERLEMLPLPPRAHDPGLLDLVVVDRQSTVRVAGAIYSVPSIWKGLQIKAWRHAARIVFTDGRTAVERPRVPVHKKHIVYTDYLPDLARKPQALEQIAPQLVAQLGEPFDQVWAHLVATRGRQAAAQAFKVVVAAIVNSGETEVGRLLRRAMDAGDDPILSIRPPSPPPSTPPLPAALAGLNVEATNLQIFDQLLGVAK